MKIRIKGMKIVGINTIRKAIDKSKLILIDTTINGKNKTFTGKRWVNPSSALNLFKEEIGVKKDTTLKFTLKSNKKVSLNEKELAETYLEKNKGQSLQTFIKEFFTIGKETSTSNKTERAIKDKQLSLSEKIINKFKNNTSRKNNIKTTADLVKLASDTSKIFGTKMDSVEFTDNDYMDSRGSCQFYPDSFEVERMDYGALLLQTKDERKKEYKIKTVFHECFHLKANRYKCEYIDLYTKDLRKWNEMEEVMAECAGQYLYNEYDKEEKLAPAYTRFLFNNLPKLKRLDEYKDCKSIYDFGKKAFTDRIESDSIKWIPLYEKLQSINISSEYYKPYEEYVEKNINKLSDRIIENSPQLADDKETIKNNFKEYVNSKATSPGEEISNEVKFDYEEFIVNAMLDMGVL